VKHQRHKQRTRFLRNLKQGKEKMLVGCQTGSDSDGKDELSPDWREFVVDFLTAAGKKGRRAEDVARTEE
jgi:hypothetical protein